MAGSLAPLEFCCECVIIVAGQKRPHSPGLSNPSGHNVQGPSIRQTAAFVRAAHAGATAYGRPRWARSLEIMFLLPEVLPGITVTHAERQVALLRDVLRATAETEESLLRAGFPEGVVASVQRLTRFDAGFPFLEHVAVVAESRDLAAKRVMMAAFLREERSAEASAEAPEARDRRRKAMDIMRRRLGY